jgi:alpha-1,3-mannosyltransferase
VFGHNERLPKRESTESFPIHRIPFIGFRRFFLPLASPRLIRRFDIVHVHAADQLLDLTSIIGLGGRPSLFMTTHGLFFHTDAYAALKKIYLRTVTRWSLNQQAAVFAVSNNDKEVLKTIGIDANLLRNPIVPMGDFICDGPDLMYIGRLSANKRIDGLIAFMAHLVKEAPSIKLHIVGSDTERLWQRYSSLHALQRSLPGNPCAIRMWACHEL